MITLRLPIPPSVNALYANSRHAGRGRFKTKLYRNWIKEADGYYLTQKPIVSVVGPYTATIEIPKTRGDVDNRSKAVLDYLVRVGLTSDDRHCRKVSVAVNETLDCCEVTIRPA